MTNWEEKLAEKAQKINRLNKQAVGNTRQDMTRPILESLLADGYNLVTWDSGNSRHSICVDLNRQVWELDQFLIGLEHDAPLFERSHPGDISCSLVVSGPNLPDVRVDSYGHTDEEIGIPEPKEVKPIPVKKVRMPREPKPKVVRSPTKPEKKYLYVPKKQWEEIKEQPSQPTEDEQEEWLRDLERETSLNKARNLLKGIIEE
jgi:hypothetical protein